MRAVARLRLALARLKRAVANGLSGVRTVMTNQTIQATKTAVAVIVLTRISALKRAGSAAIE